MLVFFPSDIWCLMLKGLFSGSLLHVICYIRWKEKDRRHQIKLTYGNSYNYLRNLSDNTSTSVIFGGHFPSDH